MNAEVRRRKVKDSGGSGQTRRPFKKPRSSNKSSGIQRSLICLILSGSILIIFLGVYLDSATWRLSHKAVDHLAHKLGYSDPVYAVVIDAGSTGSRVLAYSFHKTYLDGQLVLDKELFRERKPGLSAYAANPKEGAQSISELIDHAKAEIPEQYWNTTPVILKATAGLRLLPKNQAEGLLNAVRDLFKTIPFTTDENSVAIMDGVDEGIFSWFTVNFLLGLLNKGPEQMVAALDLGGGSTQVTFTPTTPSTLAQKEYIHEIELDTGKIPLFTHSYLGLGLQAARKAVFDHGLVPNDTVVKSECVNPIVSNRKWIYSNVEYKVNGPIDKKFRKEGANKFGIEEEVPIVDHGKCTNIIRKYINSKVRPLSELHTRPINAFSYYYDRASEYGLIDPYEGGVTKVEDLKKAAQQACNDANVDQPFMCLDLSFISILLEDGFGLQPSTKLNLYKKIGGHEISWALGAAFNHLKMRHL